MRQLNITSQTVQTLPSLGVLTNIVELAHYDMIYIYHKMKEKDEVSLQRNHNHVFDKNAVSVYFKGFKIGSISTKVNTIIARHLDRGSKVVARVKNIKKQKYAPLTELDIEVMILSVVEPSLKTTYRSKALDRRCSSH